MKYGDIDDVTRPPDGPQLLALLLTGVRQDIEAGESDKDLGEAYWPLMRRIVETAHAEMVAEVAAKRAIWYEMRHRGAKPDS